MYWIIATIALPVLFVLIIEGSLSGCSGMGLIFFWVYGTPISMVLMGFAAWVIWEIRKRKEEKGTDHTV